MTIGVIMLATTAKVTDEVEENGPVNDAPKKNLEKARRGEEEHEERSPLLNSADL